MTLDPSPKTLALLDSRQRWGRALAPWLLAPVIGLDVRGREVVPPDGPLLIAANHATVLDPVIVGIAVERPVIWVGTRTLLDGPLAGVVRGLGMIPKTRFAADLPAVRRMLRWLHAGAAVGVFPEGERTWDGRLQPLVPGIGRMADRLGVPVLTARVHNSYRVWPRWTPRPRRGRVGVELTAPWQPGEGGAEAVAAHLRASLDVDPRSRPDWRVRGRALARGITNVVFRCPACDAMERMVEEGSAVRCTACGTRWTVDGQVRLCRDGEAPLEVDAWMAETRRRTLAERPDRGEVLSTDGVVLEDHTTGRPSVLGTGRLVLEDGRLSLRAGPSELWSLPVDALHNVNVEYQRTLELRTAHAYLKATIPTGSAWRWPWTIRG